MKNFIITFALLLSFTASAGDNFTCYIYASYQDASGVEHEIDEADLIVRVDAPEIRFANSSWSLAIKSDHNWEDNNISLVVKDHNNTVKAEALSSGNSKFLALLVGENLEVICKR